MYTLVSSGCLSFYKYIKPHLYPGIHGRHDKLNQIQKFYCPQPCNQKKITLPQVFGKNQTYKEIPRRLVSSRLNDKIYKVPASGTAIQPGSVHSVQFGFILLPVSTLHTLERKAVKFKDALQKEVAVLLDQKYLEGMLDYKKGLSL